MKSTYIKIGSLGLSGLISTTVISSDEGLQEVSKERIYGEPGSIRQDATNVDSLLKLSMAKVNLPREVWHDIEQLNQMWMKLLSSNVLENYSSDIEQIKISAVTKNKISDSSEHQIILALSDKYLLSLVELGDYEGLLLELEKRGLIYQDVESSLSRKMQSLLESDQSLKNGLSRQLETLRSHVEEENDIAILNKLIIPTDAGMQSGVAAAAVLVVVAVGVATYVAAAVNVAAALNVAVQLSVAVNVAVTVSGGGGSGGGGGSCRGCHSIGLRSIDPKLNHNYSLLERFANIGGNPILHTRSAIELKKTEARAVLQAAINLGLVEIEEGNMDKVFMTLDNISDKSLML